MSQPPEETGKCAAGLRVVIDRLEEDWAVILLSEDDAVQFDLPLKYLPPGTQAGDHLTLSFERDPASAETARRRIAELKKELTQNQDPNQKTFKL
jgi:hypothetical protein